MGWDTGDVFKRGDWVAINMGHEPTKIMDVDRRRLGLDDPETALALIHSDPIVAGYITANSQQEAWEYLQETEATYQHRVCPLNIYSFISPRFNQNLTRNPRGTATGQKSEE